MAELIWRPYIVADAEKLVQVGVHPVLARIFAARGITDTAQLHGDVSALLHWQTLKNIHLAANWLADAVQQQISVLVVADYDADGATACALAVRGFRLFGLTVDYWVPNRFVHGYGLSEDVVREVVQRQPRPELIVTVDNGMSSRKGVRLAQALGIRVLVTDHHLPGDEVPDTVIVNPNQQDCPFEDKSLAGVGVMFYVLLATRAVLRERGCLPEVINLSGLLDLVALGTIADVVRLGHNNRILVEQGLRRMRAGRACAGVRALFVVSGRDIARATSGDLGFMIGPRLNAAGRLDDMSTGIACLLLDDDKEALLCAEQLHQLNVDRREIEQSMQQQVCLPEPDKLGYSLVLFDPAWHVGVIGILASRLKERHHRPTLCFARGDKGEIKGSGRSIAGLHLRDALDWVSKREPGLIVKFGGHAAAAGLSIAERDFAVFAAVFEQAARSMLSAEDLQAQLLVDARLVADEITDELAQAIARQVWGQGFPAPVFQGVFQVKSQQLLKDRHLKLQLGMAGQGWDAILFQCTDRLPEEICALYQLDWNVFQGRGRVQLRLLAWRQHDDCCF